MNIQQFLPKQSLNPFVQQYVLLEDFSADTTFAQQQLFSLGNQYLVFVLKGEITFRPSDHAPFTLPEASVVGPFTCSGSVKMTGPSSAVVVQLNVCGSHRLLGLSMDTVTNYYRDLSKLDAGQWKYLGRELATTDDIVSLLDRALEKALKEQERSLQGVDEILEHLLLQNGNVDMESVALYFKTSRHTLERRFMEVTGLTPQMYGRIARFNTAMQSIKEDMHTQQWQDVLQDCGYGDQNHFIKDFLYFGAPKTEKEPKTPQVSLRKIFKLAETMYPQYKTAFN